MSHFYAKITESARSTVPTARGHHSIETVTQSWKGQIKVRMWRCNQTQVEQYTVILQPHGRQDDRGIIIMEGDLDSIQKYGIF